MNSEGEAVGGEATTLGPVFVKLWLVGVPRGDHGGGGNVVDFGIVALRSADGSGSHAVEAVSRVCARQQRAALEFGQRVG